MKILAVATAFAIALPNHTSAQQPLDAQKLFREVSSSVVKVAGSNDDGESMQGSGVVIAAKTVVTNCHVVGGSNQSTVEHMDELYSASLLASDEEHDLCLLNVPGIEARAIKLGSSTSSEVGETVFAVGAPRGFSNSLSQGIVSGLRRVGNAKLIQTTAAISHGSSGGGLFNARGDLIGITTLYIDDSQQLNFAVPAEWVHSLMTGGIHAAHRPVNGQDSAAEAARAAGEAQAAADAAAAAADIAAPNPWVEVSSSDSMSISFKKGTFEVGENKGGELIAVAMAQIRRLATDEIEFRKHYVRVQDCRAGHGQLVSLNIDGKYAGEVDFVSEGGTVASGIADALCTLYFLDNNKQH